jgi:ABC transporter, phosphonate, periplasmic substrate-binding protein
MRNVQSLLIRFIWLVAGGLLAAAPASAAAPIHFLLIQPGSPGTTEEAAPVIGRLADYLAQHLPKGTAVAGLYLNSIDQVAPAVAQQKPRIAIVTLPYYLEHRAAYDWRPQLTTRPLPAGQAGGGKTEDHYHLLVSTANPAAGWEKLTGAVAGTICFTPEPVARLLFDRPAAALPFHCQPTDRLLRASRQVARGELAGLIVTDEQFTSLMMLPEGTSLKELHATGPLVPPLVVTFGPPDAPVESVIQALRGMKDDPAAHELLTELRTDGFGPVDSAVLERIQSAFENTAGRAR